jgi:RNA polymerase sigma-70 factor (ECF subfamily)
MAPDGTLSDRDLAEALRQNGDERAFRALYRRHTPQLFPFLRRLVGGEQVDAEDVVQETWLRAVQSLDRFRWESAFSTWLSGIGVNVTRDWMRRRGRSLESAWDDGFDAPLPETPHGQRIDLERAIAALPDGARAVLVLHDVEGWPHDTIAERLGISTGTSKSQLHRARRALRTWLAPAPEGHRA